MKKISIALLLLSVCISYQTSAQITLYTQNFDGSSSLPSGWYATPNSWFNDTTAGNTSSGYPGASGLNNIVIKDTTAAPGTDSLITAPISTVGFDNITVDWGTRFSKHFADSGSSVSLYWSTNGTTWTNVSYIENANNSTWLLENDSTPILLPAGAANQASLQLMWVADIHFTPSGTYRIDDLIVAGDSIHTTGIINLSDNDFAKVYVSSNSNINISVIQPVTENLNAEIYDLTGRLISKRNMETQTLVVDGRDLSKGVYFVKVSDPNNTITTKVLIK